MKFSAGVRNSIQSWIRASCPCRRGDGRECFQVPEEGIHDAAERMMHLTRKTPFKIATVLSYYTWRGNTCVTILSIICFITGRIVRIKVLKMVHLFFIFAHTTLPNQHAKYNQFFKVGTSNKMDIFIPTKLLLYLILWTFWVKNSKNDSLSL